MQKWPADKITRRKVADLVPHAKNARVHSDRQVDQLADSIQEWGWTVPVLIDPDGGIIAGHGRIMAAQKLGIEDVPCMVADGWTEAQKRAYVIADNKLAINADWDTDMLSFELKGLGALDFSMTLIGFDDAELGQLFTDDQSANDPYAEWEGMPEFSQQDKTAFRSIVLHFHDQDGVEQFSKAIGKEISPKARYLWYPEIVIDTHVDKRYVGDES